LLPAASAGFLLSYEGLLRVGQHALGFVVDALWKSCGADCACVATIVGLASHIDGRFLLAGFNGGFQRRISMAD